jgi:hypothetical protein
MGAIRSKTFKALLLTLFTLTGAGVWLLGPGANPVIASNESGWEVRGQAGFSENSIMLPDLFLYTTSDGQLVVPYVSYIESYTGNEDTGYKFVVKELFNNEWRTVGETSLPTGGTHFPVLYVRSGSPYVAFTDYANGKRPTVKTYNGYNWVTLGNAGFSDYLAVPTSIFAGGPGEGTYVAMMEGISNSPTTTLKITVKTYSGDSWVNVGTPRFGDGYAMLDLCQ